MENSPYLLIAEDEPDLVEALEIIVEANCSLPIKKASSGNKAIEILKNHPNPAFILTDYRMPDGNGIDLFRAAKNMGINCPIVFCTGSPKSEILDIEPSVQLFLEKPNVFEPLSLMLKQHFQQKPSEYIPIPIRIWLSLGVAPSDVYLKLGENNFVKILPEGEVFTQEDANKYLGKKVANLYFNSTDGKKFASIFSVQLSTKCLTKKMSADEMQDLSQAAYEATATLYRGFGWGKELAEIVDSSYRGTLEYISQNPKLKSLLFHSNRANDRYLTAHSHFVGALSCIITKKIGWDSNFTYAKLTLAALLHDLTIPVHLEEKIVKGEKILESEYLMHPNEAAELLHDLEGAPPDVDIIIKQHHECPDGSGFPAQLQWPKISPLSAVFIAAHELSKFVWNKTDMPKAFEEFVENKKDLYKSGHFKKILEAVKELGNESI